MFSWCEWGIRRTWFNFIAKKWSRLKRVTLQLHVYLFRILIYLDISKLRSSYVRSFVFFVFSFPYSRFQKPWLLWWRVRKLPWVGGEILFHGQKHSQPDVGPNFKSSTTLVNRKLVCFQPVGILNNVMFNLNYLFQLCAHPSLAFVP